MAPQEAQHDCKLEALSMRGWTALVVLGTFATLGQGAETPLVWPQFRGPGGSGVADGQKPPVQFDAHKNVKWKVPVPSGLSSPIIAGDKLILTALDGDKLFTIAYDRATGKEAWRAHAPAKKLELYNKTEGSPAASTPVTDGKRIVSYFGSCGLFCYDLSGKELWHYDLPTAVTSGNFGTGVSPVLADDLVILLRDVPKDAKILALDLATGNRKWETKRASPVSYCTPVVWDTPAGKQVVAPGHGRLIAYDVKTGQEKWSVAGMPAGVVASPVVADGVLCFAGWSPGGGADKDFKVPTFDELLKKLDKDGDGAISREEAKNSEIEDGFDSVDTNGDGRLTRDEWDAVIKFFAEGRNSAFAVKAGAHGDATASHVLWKKTRGLPYVPSGIVYHGQYFLVKDGGLVTAYDVKTGKEIYVQERAAAEGRYNSSPVAANGYIYVTKFEDGIVTVLKAGGPRPEVAARNAALDERVCATPAIADDTLYFRTEGHLYAFSETK
jgi:outer membrane protein assembly factor BamB